MDINLEKSQGNPFRSPDLILHFEHGAFDARRKNRFRRVLPFSVNSQSKTKVAYAGHEK